MSGVGLSKVLILSVCRVIKEIKSRLFLRCDADAIHATKGSSIVCSIAREWWSLLTPSFVQCFSILTSCFLHFCLD